MFLFRRRRHFEDGETVFDYDVLNFVARVRWPTLELPFKISACLSLRIKAKNELQKFVGDVSCSGMRSGTFVQMEPAPQAKAMYRTGARAMTVLEREGISRGET